MTMPKRRKDESEESYAIRREIALERQRAIGRKTSHRRRRCGPIEVIDLPGEEWRPVVGFEGRYEVSNLGRARGVTRDTSLGCHVRRVWGRLLAAHHHQAGYLVVDLRIENRRTTCYVHRLVLEAFVGPCPEGMECRHLNGIRDDNRLENLSWGTYEEQAEDKTRHGTMPFGEAHWNAKLSEADVCRIRTLAANGVTLKVIGLAFDTSPSTVGQIVRMLSRKAG